MSMEDWGVSTIRSLRQRVEELDKGVEHWRKFYEETRAAQTSAEARLAQCVEALLEISGRALASQTHEIGPLEEVEDARSYAAEIAQGVSHYPHEEAEPCVRCRAERAEAEVARLQGSIASYQAAAHNYVNEHAEVERLREALRECQRVFDHPAFTDRAGIGDVVRAALRGER